MRNWIDKYHIIRRILVFAITFIFLKITLHIFNNQTLNTYSVSAYGILCGLETLIIKFYLNSRDNEDKNDKQ